MKDFAKELEQAATFVEVSWDAARVARGEREMAARKRRRAMRWRAALASVVVTFAVGGWAMFSTQSPQPIVAAPAPPRERTLALGERSRVLIEDEAEARPSSTGKMDLELMRGRARFTVDERAPLRIQAGVVSLEVRGARFAVERLEQETRVRVDEGQVIVLDVEGTHALSAGADERFVPPRPVEARAPAPAPQVEKRAPREPARKTWQQLAAAGDYDQAYEAMQRGPVVPDTTALLLAADVARLSHHPAQAVEPLGRILSSHGEDPRAPLAAFTLGRVLLDELGQPTEAAAAFARAQALAPDGPLVEDAFAREVEAWSRAGDTEQARGRAEAYLRRYPEGHRLRAVRRFGGLE